MFTLQLNLGSVDPKPSETKVFEYLEASTKLYKSIFANKSLSKGLSGS